MTQPLISLITPAWNEAAYLPKLLQSVDAAKDRFLFGRDRVETIIADNGSTDATAELATARGCRVVTVEKRCIAAARNGGAAAASGEIIAFADADFVLHPETFNFIYQVLQSPRFIGGGTGLTMERWSWGIRATWYLILPPLWLLGIDGGVWFCRREDFFAAGGYNENIRAGEDVMFLRKLQKLGKSRTPRQRLATRFTAKRLKLPAAIAVNSARKFDQHGDWHMFRDALVKLPKLLWQGRRTIDDHIESYWYANRWTPKE